MVRFPKAFFGRFSLNLKGTRKNPKTISEKFLGNGLQRLESGICELFVLGNRTKTLDVEIPEQFSLVLCGRPFLLNETEKPLLNDKFNPEFLKCLDGCFSFLLLSDTRGVLATDLLGAGGLYVHQTVQDEVYFSNHLGLLISLLNQFPGISEIGCAEIVMGGFCSRGRTPYQGIEKLKAGEYLEITVENDTLVVNKSRYAALADLVGEPDRLSPADRYDRLAELIAESLRREVAHGANGIFLSSGMDSNALVFGAKSGDINIGPAVTYGEARSTDARGAKRFARSQKLNHNIIPYRDWRFSDFAEHVCLLSAGSCGIQVAHNVAGFQRSVGHFDIGVSGMMGDAISGQNIGRTPQEVFEKRYRFRAFFNEKMKDAFSEEYRLLLHEIEVENFLESDLSTEKKCIISDIETRQACMMAITFSLCDWIVPLSYPFLTGIFSLSF